MNDEYWAEIAKILPDVKGKCVIDLCCNAGLTSFELAKLGAEVHGFESDVRYLNQAEFISRRKMQRPSFYLADVEYVNFESFQPDLVMALSCLYHLRAPKLMVKRLCSLDCDLVVSTRNYLHNEYMAYFSAYGREPKEIAYYGKKTAVRL